MQCLASTTVKTRTLLLLSLGCALAILGAGIGLLWQLGGDQSVSPVHTVGETVTVGDLDVTVLKVDASGGQIEVTAEIGGTDDRTVTDGIILIVAGAPHTVVNDDCNPATSAKRVCALVFAASASDQVVMSIRRGEEQARWALSPD